MSIGLAGAGCQSPDPMPGTWKLYVAGGGADAPVSGRAEFKPDGTCEMSTVAGKAVWRFKGTYAVKGSELEIDGEASTDDPGGYDAVAQVKREPVHKTERLSAKGTIAENKKSFRINGKDFVKQ